MQMQTIVEKANRLAKLMTPVETFGNLELAVVGYNLDRAQLIVNKIVGLDHNIRVQRYSANPLMTTVRGRRRVMLLVEQDLYLATEVRTAFVCTLTTASSMLSAAGEKTTPHDLLVEYDYETDAV